MPKAQHILDQTTPNAIMMQPIIEDAIPSFKNSGFAGLNLSEPLLKAITKSGYNNPTPIQEQAIPRALAGKDLIATAQTGTGKTAAFVLPILEYINNSEPVRIPRALVLTPTRELAAQVTTAFTKYGSFLRLNVVSIVGGMPYHAQLRQLSRPVDVVVATPGRLIDYLERGKLDLSAVQMLILDEADRMLDMGFIDDVKHIAKSISDTKQTLLFTATMDNKLNKLAQTILNSPERIEIASKTMTVDKISQRLYVADNEQHKNKLLQHLLTEEQVYKVIIFSATKRNADKLAKQLYQDGHEAAALHGDMNQGKRNRTIAQLRKGDINVLVATDVAARGIDIADITHVINYDLPKFSEDYVHRIGRTGRAGKSGTAISLALVDEINHLRKIEKFTGHTIAQAVIEGLEPTKKINTQSNSNDSKFSRHKKPWHKSKSNGNGNSWGKKKSFSGNGKKKY